MTHEKRQLSGVNGPVVVDSERLREVLETCLCQVAETAGYYAELAGATT